MKSSTDLEAVRSRLPIGALFLALLLALLPTSPGRAAETLILKDASRAVRMGPYLEVLADPSGALTIADLAAGDAAKRFRAAPKGIVNFGMTGHAHWLRFTIDDRSNRRGPWLIELKFPLMDYVDFYLPRADGGFQVKRSGDLRPMSSREIPERNILFSLAPQRGPATYYLRGQIEGRAQFPLTLYSDEGFRQENTLRRQAASFFAGMILAMILFGLFLYLFLGGSSILSYVFYIVTHTLFQACIYGYLYGFLFPELPRAHDYAVQLAATLPMLSALLFTRLFLKVALYAPRYDRMLRIMVWANAWLLPLAFVIPPLAFKRLLNLDLLAVSVVSILAAVAVIRKGYTPAYYFLTARLFLATSSCLLILSNLGLIPVLSTFSFAVGILLDCSFMSLALCHHVLLIKRRTESGQEQMRRNTQLAMIGEMAAGIAHEVNTPINTIINSSQLILQAENREELERDVGIIRSEGRRIAGIVGGLLSCARLSQGEKTACPVDRLLADTVCLLEAKLRQERIKPVVEIPEGLPPVVANYQQIQQVIINVVNNAASALSEKHPGGHQDKELRITCEKALLSRKPFVRLTFYDRGCGIAPQLMDKVMTPFFTTKPQGMGTGLGLSISHGIVSEHGGRLRLESVLGEYTRAIMELPAAAGEE